MNHTTLRMNWEKLLSDERPPRPPVGQKQIDIVFPQEIDDFCRSEFQRDYDRVIFSAPFRRLAGKTQVHPFAEMDQVHNRLTHSLEVASVGRSLGYAVGRFISEKGEMPAKRDLSDIIYIVQAACLAHDIGNPPFGHAGEDAIRAWVKSNAATLFGNEMATNLHGIACDWMNFEGNAQGFRMVSRSDNRDQLYFRFTYASLGTMLKYPWTAKDPRAQAKGKLGAFSSEESIFRRVTESLGLRKADGSVIRHPLSFLSEAADDICYRIGDFEDAVHMHILPECEVRMIFSKIAGGDSGKPLSAMRALAINSLTHAAFYSFKSNYDAIMHGDLAHPFDLKSDFPEPQKTALNEIKEKYPEIFAHRRKIVTELGAYNVLGRLLSIFSKVAKQLADCNEYEKLGFIDKRCVALAWGESYAKEHLRRPYEWWLGRVMDFISGMTDHYATQVASEIEGF